MRIAFLSNEFVIEKPDSGGLGNYLNRITQVLARQGHDVELFVTKYKKNTPDYLNYNGVSVYHVPILKNHRYHYLRKLDKLFLKSPWWALSEYYGIASSLALKLEERHAVLPFDAVQSTNCAAAGLFVKSNISRPHIVRLSSIRELGLSTDGFLKSVGGRLLIYLENKSVSKGNLIYAPCAFTANYYKNKKKKNVHVIRPPYFNEFIHADISHLNLPDRYMIHFGSIGRVKGSDLLAEALKLVWQKAPEFSMLWLGKERKGGEMKEYRSLWGDFSRNIIWFEGMIKSELYPLIQKAEASVLPSRIDNLPNTIIESLSLQTPVIAFNGASVDEMVEHGKSGLLVEMGNVEELANAILYAWNHRGIWLENGFQRPVILDEMLPENAAHNLLEMIAKVKDKNVAKL